MSFWLESEVTFCFADSMTQPDAKLLLRRSWAIATTNKEALGLLFYKKLFQIAPETEPLFKQDIGSQAAKLIATLSFIIDSLDEEEALQQAAGDLAIRHVGYNVTADQYTAVGKALVETLHEVLGTKFDKITEAAWVDTYTALSKHMISTAYG